MPANDDRSDAELLAAVRAGDDAAFGVLWSRHERAARMFARRLTRPSDVDDLVSETFFRVLRRLRAGDGPDEAVRPYLLSAMRRLSIDASRAAYRRVHLVGDQQALASAVHAPSADEIASEVGEFSIAWRAWSSLPEADRTLLWHLVIDENTPSQLARHLGTSANAVRLRAARARERLRQAYLQQQINDVEDEACAPIRRRLGEYVRGGLSAREREIASTHLEQCEACRRAADELGDLNRTLRVVLGPLVLGGALAARPRMRRPHWPLAAAGAGAAAAVAAVVALVALGGSHAPHRTPDQPPITLAARSTGSTSTRSIAISPGPMRADRLAITASPGWLIDGVSGLACAPHHDGSVSCSGPARARFDVTVSGPSHGRGWLQIVYIASAGERVIRRYSA